MRSRFRGFGGEGAGGVDGAGVFGAQAVDAGGGQRQFLAADALHFGYPGVGIEVGCGEKLVAGLFDGVFHSQPVEQRALGLLLAGGDFDQAPDGMGSHRRPALSHLWSGQAMVCPVFFMDPFTEALCFTGPGGGLKSVNSTVTPRPRRYSAFDNEVSHRQY